MLFGVGRDYMSSLLNAWNETGEKLKPWTSKVMPNFEEVVKTFQHDAPLTKQAQLRFRKVLGMLTWVALSRSDLTFSVSYLARGQADPRQSLEACMRSLLRWIQLGENLHKMQSFPTPKPLRTSGPTELVAYVDASWNLQSVSGGIVTYQGITLKTFSRKQDVPAMSSAEAELAAKGAVVDWVPARHVEEWDPVGCLRMPQDTTPLFEDGALYGLAVRPEHHGHVWTSPPGDAAVIQAVREVDVSAADGGGVDFDLPSLSLVRPQKRVSFSMKVDGVWWLEDRADRDQVYVIPLGLNSQKPVVVEICASPNSAIWQACRDRGLECISVTKEERNLLTRETRKELYRLRLCSNKYVRLSGNQPFMHDALAESGQLSDFPRRHERSRCDPGWSVGNKDSTATAPQLSLSQW